MTHIGIDNGLTGAIAAIREGKLFLRSMPVLHDGKKNRVDVVRLRTIMKLFSSGADAFIVYESVAGSKSVRAAVSMADSFARTEAVLILGNYRREPITARKWQKIYWSVPKMAKGVKFDTKAAALNKARQIWPDETWLRTSKCRKPDEGFVDAALIAEFCRRTYS